MKKLLILVITLLLAATTSFAAEVQKNKVGYVSITYETKDNFVIKSKLFYPPQKQEVYPAVVMLHSIGYSCEYWEQLTKEFVHQGVAVLLVDLRGHGQSVYDSNFKVRYWRNYTDKTFAKYPNDIYEILSYIAMNYKNISTSNYVIIGADIGANTAILAAEKMPNKPKALVLLSPTRIYKGLYTPIAMTNLGGMSIMSMVSVRDKYSYNETQELKKFAQGVFDIKTYPSGGMGMLMLKVNPSMNKDIVDWVLPKIKTVN